MNTLTASIGFGVLLNSIRLEANHIEYRSVDTFDPVATGCDHCSIDRIHCKDCLLKRFKTTTEKVYINEKARYGKRQFVSKFGVLALLWLHFRNPDEKGVIDKVDVLDLCHDIGCTRRTAVNVLKDLADYGYIAITKLDVPGYYRVHLCDYTSYFKPASEGGRGYMTISHEMFLKLTELKDINSLRLTIRGILTASEQKRKTGFVEEKSLKEMHYELPAYVTNKKIREILSSDVFTSMFEVYDKKYTISFKLKNDYMQHGMRDKLISDCKESVLRCVKELAKQAPKQKPFRLDDYQLKCISEIGVKFPAGYVVDAVKSVFQTYHMNDIAIQDIGALVRTIVKQRVRMDEIIAA